MTDETRRPPAAPGLLTARLEDIPDTELGGVQPLDTLGKGERADPLAKAPALSAHLDDVARERAPGDPEEGSTPLPEEWRLMRAVFGGASRNELETYYEQDPPLVMGWATRALDRALADGRLSAGLHVVTGHTGGGKTGLACNLALAAVRQGHPVVYVSLELDPQELAARLVALEARISWASLNLHRPLSDSERAERDAAIGRLREPLTRVHVWAPDPGPYDDAPTVRELRDLVLSAWRQHGRTPLVVFDYLQAPGIFGKDEEAERRLPLRERIAAITMQLRHLSKQHVTAEGERWPGCPVLVLSTTARGNVKGEGANGMTGEDPDLLRKDPIEVLKALPKEAGEVEATSVTAWALALEASEGRTKRLTLRLAKNRRGPNGQWLPLQFDGVTGEITDDAARYLAAVREDRARGERKDDGRPEAPAPAGARGAAAAKGAASSLDLLEASTSGRRGGA